MTTLHTPRLTLRPWQLSDLDDFYEYAKHPDVGIHAGWKPHESKEESAEILAKFIEVNDTLAIELKENGKVIGSLGIHPTRYRSSVNAKCIGYVLSADYWGKGLMTEAAKAAIRYVFEELKSDILEINHFNTNNRSRRVIEKCGFVYEGTLRHARKLLDGSIVDDVRYSMLKSEYEELKDKGAFG